MQSNFKLVYCENGKMQTAKCDSIEEIREWAELLKDEPSNEDAYFTTKGSTTKTSLNKVYIPKTNK